MKPSVGVPKCEKCAAVAGGPRRGKSVDKGLGFLLGHARLHQLILRFNESPMWLSGGNRTSPSGRHPDRHLRTDTLAHRPAARALIVQALDPFAPYGDALVATCAALRSIGPFGDTQLLRDRLAQTLSRVCAQ